VSRIWDVPCRELDDIGLLAEHRELHGVWVGITEKKRGYARHPETLRWQGHLSALYARHDEQVREMARRGWPSGTWHRSPLDRRRIARGASGTRPARLLPLHAQRALLRVKNRTRSRTPRRRKR
jgi:pyrimidine dimer DNA glycosylase